MITNKKIPTEEEFEKEFQEFFRKKYGDGVSVSVGRVRVSEPQTTSDQTGGEPPEPKKPFDL